MTIEISEASYRILQEKTERGMYPSVEIALEDAVRRLSRMLQEADRVRALVQEGLRSAQEDELVDGEAFFQRLHERRSKAA